MRRLAAGTGVPEENIVLAENGVSVDLVAGRASVSGAVPTGKMFVDGLVSGDVGETVVGERLILSSGFIGVTVVLRSGTGKLASAAASALARFLRGSEGAGTRALARSRRRWKPLPPRTGHRCQPHRPGGTPRCRQVGRRDLSPPADDRADGHRDLARAGQVFSAYAVHSSCDAVRLRPAGSM